jgi:UDP-glucose 4-epimerase
MTANSNNRALVTGGAGFIGSHLVDRLLDEGWAVDVIDDLSTGSLGNLGPARAAHPGRVKFHRQDLRDATLDQVVAKSSPDVVFHLAAQADVRVSVADPVRDAEINLIGTLRLCEAARAAGATKVVFAGSGGTLYGVPEKLPVPEDHPRKPIAPYGLSKQAAGLYLDYYREQRGFDTTILALANVYGPRQDTAGMGEAGVVSIFARQLLAGKACTIFGDGEQTRDFVYVDDVVDAFVRAAASDTGVGLGNVGTGVETSVNDLHAAMLKVTKKRVKAVYAPARPGELPRSALDPSYLKSALGWAASMPLEEGLRRTLDWFREATA